MTKIKPPPKLLESVPRVLPVACFIDGDVGGVGKSMLAIFIAMMFSLVNAALQIFELDEQGKLKRFCGPEVQALHAARLEVNADGERDLLPAFEPFHQALTTMPETGTSLLLEVGGALTELMNAYIAEVDIDDDITALGLTVIVFLVMVATEESVRQVLSQAKTLRRILPSAQLVIVLNGRDGCPVSASHKMSEGLAEDLARLIADHLTIRMPRLPWRSRRLFDSLGENPATIMSWRKDHFREARVRTKESLAYAKCFVTDVAVWTGEIRKELLRILPFLREDHG